MNNTMPTPSISKVYPSDKMADNNIMHVNELLSYITYSHRSGSSQFLKNIIKHKFDELDVKVGKHLIWQLGRETLGRCPTRTKSSQRPALDANIEDIIKAVEHLDAVNKLPVFVAKDLGKLPDLQPEELNRLFYINRVATLEKQVSQHTDELDTVNKNIMELKDDIKGKINEMKKLSDSLMSRINSCNESEEESYCIKDIYNSSVMSKGFGVRLHKCCKNNSIEILENNELSMINNPGSRCEISADENPDESNASNNETNKIIPEQQQHVPLHQQEQHNDLQQQQQQVEQYQEQHNNQQQQQQQSVHHQEQHNDQQQKQFQQQQLQQHQQLFQQQLQKYNQIQQYQHI